MKKRPIFIPIPVSLEWNKNIDSLEQKIDSLNKALEYQKTRIDELEKYMKLINGKQIEKLKEEEAEDEENKDEEKSRKGIKLNIFKKD